MTITRNFLTVALALVLTLALIACGSSDSTTTDTTSTTTDTYSDATFDGVWFLDVSSIDGGNMYVVSDGAGGLDDHSFFYYPATGSYTVSSDGSISITSQPGDADEMTLNGTLTSSTAGTITSIDGDSGSYNLPLNKLSDTSTLSGTIAGTLTETCTDGGIYPEICDGTEFTVSGLTVDSTGSVTGGTISNSVDGVPTFTVNSGGAYSLDGDVVIQLYTDATNASDWEQTYGIIQVQSTLSGTAIAGGYVTDSGIDVGTGTATLTLTP